MTEQEWTHPGTRRVTRPEALVQVVSDSLPQSFANNDRFAVLPPTDSIGGVMLLYEYRREDPLWRIPNRGKDPLHQIPFVEWELAIGDALTVGRVLKGARATDPDVFEWQRSWGNHAVDLEMSGIGLAGFARSGWLDGGRPHPRALVPVRYCWWDGERELPEQTYEILAVFPSAGGMPATLVFEDLDYTAHGGDVWQEVILDASAANDVAESLISLAVRHAHD